MGEAALNRHAVRNWIAGKYAFIKIGRRHGQGVLRQAAGILRCKLANPTLGATDYYTYRFYDERIGGRADPRDYLGWRVMEDVAHALNSRAVAMPGWDKYTFHLYAEKFGFPAAAVLAQFRPTAQAGAASSPPLLRSPAELAAWLRLNQCWPVFAKPCYSMQSVGCFHLVGYHPEDDTLALLDGGRIAVSDFVDRKVFGASAGYFKREMGYLFQEVLRPHPAIVELVGNTTISGARVVVVQDEEGPEAIAAFWRIARENCVSDLWTGGRSGHLSAPIDLASGRVGIAINGLESKDYTHSPETGRAIDGFVMPDWPQALAACLDAATVFPLMRIQHWDIAFTDRGPKLLELNDVGNVGFIQTFGRGMLTPRLRKILREKGDARRYPWIAKLCNR